MNKQQKADTQADEFYIYRSEQNITMKIKLTEQEILDIITRYFDEILNTDNQTDTSSSPSMTMNERKPRTSIKKQEKSYLKIIK